MPIIPHTFVASKKLYALDLDSFQAEEHPYNRLTQDGYPMWSYSINAVWFRKRNNGRMAAFFGRLGDISTGRPKSDGSPVTMWTLDEFLDHYSNARYGGSPYGCWDGQAAWWGDEEYRNNFELQQEMIPKLKDMLDNFPAPRTGYTGWYGLVEKN